MLNFSLNLSKTSVILFFNNIHQMHGYLNSHTLTASTPYQKHLAATVDTGKQWDNLCKGLKKMHMLFVFAYLCHVKLEPANSE